MPRYLIPLGMAFLGLILLVTGSRVGGPVYRDVRDTRGALLAHDTVPAIEQDGDTTRYRFETTRQFGANVPFTVVGLGLLVGAAVLGVRARRTRGQ